MRFATEHAALLELMFAGKHPRTSSDGLRAASDRAFAAPLAMSHEGQAAGEIVAGDPERVGTVAFAALQGLAAMVNGGMLEDGRSTTWSPRRSSASCSGCARAREL